MTPEERNWKLKTAVENNVYADVRDMLMAGADPNAQNSCESVLATACRFGQYPVIRLLLDAGADINAINIWGNTPIIQSAVYGDIESMIVLIKAGADVTARHSDGLNALDILQTLYSDKYKALVQYLKFNSDNTHLIAGRMGKTSRIAQSNILDFDFNIF